MPTLSGYVCTDIAVSCMCESTYASGAITSQTKGLPLAQGISVVPSVRLPSCMIHWFPDSKKLSTFHFAFQIISVI